MEGISQFISKFLRSSRKRAKQSCSTLPEGLCRRFSLPEIKIATNNFDNNLVIGSKGSFGTVYKGFINDRTINVAIKRKYVLSPQDLKGFRTEVLLVCQLRHPNIVPLIGFCLTENEVFLVYEFMVNGSLGNHAYGANLDDPLPWKQRLEICIGVARGLHYLHTGVKHTIFHRDVKTSNILLDEKWEAKLADFELAKKGPPNLSGVGSDEEDTSTTGYLFPEYVVYEQLTDKSDVYSFGVVLLELLYGRQALELGLEEEEQWYLDNWVRKCKQRGTINEIIDPFLKGKIAPECFKIYVDIATSCVRSNGKDRPTINEVELMLEHSLELQESADAARKEGEYDYPIDELTCNDSPGDAYPASVGCSYCASLPKLEEFGIQIA